MSRSPKSGSGMTGSSGGGGGGGLGLGLGGGFFFLTGTGAGCRRNLVNCSLQGSIEESSSLVGPLGNSGPTAA